jgi:WD40 repeat protein
MYRSLSRRGRYVLSGLGLAVLLFSVWAGVMYIRFRPRPPAHDRVYLGHKKNVFAIDFTPDGRHFVTDGWDGQAMLWDPAEVWPVRVLGAGQNALHDFALSPDGQTVYAVGDDPVVYRWGVSTKNKPLPPLPLPGPAKQVDLSPDGGLLAVSTADGIIHVMDSGTGNLRYRITETRGGNGAVAFSPDGRMLAVGGPRAVFILNAATRKPIHRQEAAESHLLRFAPNGRTLAIGSYYSDLLILDTATGQVRARQPIRLLSSAIYSADSRGLYTVESRGALRRDGETGVATACIAGPCRDPDWPRWMTRLMPFLGPPHKEHMGALAVSPDDKTLLYSSDSVIKRIKLQP